MRKIGNRISTPLFALLMAVSITFGVSSAFAEVRLCKDAPPTFLGACSSEAECDLKCIQAGGFDGTCTTQGCCICAI